MEVAQSFGALFKSFMWYHDSFDELSMVLWGATEELVNVFYFCEMKLRLFALVEYSQGEGDK